MFQRLDHIAIVTDDSDAALRVWRDRYGLPVLYSEDVNGGTVRLTHLDMGNAHLQIVQPLTDNHPLQAWLREHGPGLHHFCLGVEDIDAAHHWTVMCGLSGAGTTPHQAPRGKRALFLDKKSSQGIQVELTGP